MATLRWIYAIFSFLYYLGFFNTIVRDYGVFFIRVPCIMTLSYVSLKLPLSIDQWSEKVGFFNL